MISGNLASPSTVKRLMGEIDFRPGKSMGQNFLIDRNILNIILDSAELRPRDWVLEIGPGLGVVSTALIERVDRVIAIEKDRKLHRFLEEHIGRSEKLELLHADALDLDLSAILGKGVTKLVSNLPYSVASRILVEVFKSESKPEIISATLQKDVAERISAPVGSGGYGLLAILAQRFYDLRIIKEIGPNCFLPRPRVGSVLLVCRRREAALGEVDEEAFFLRMVKMTFTHRRKMIVNALRGAGFDLEPIVRALCEVGIDERLRPAQISVADWCRLGNALH